MLTPKQPGNLGYVTKQPPWVAPLAPPHPLPLCQSRVVATANRLERVSNKEILRTGSFD